jgi:RNase P subunit RPR2
MNAILSGAVRYNERETTAVGLNPLVGSSHFYVSVLYQHDAESRSVENEMPQAYCVKCKTSIEIKNPQNVTLKNGKPAVKGVCPNCGTSVFRIGKA